MTGQSERYSRPESVGRLPRLGGLVVRPRLPELGTRPTVMRYANRKGGNSAVQQPT